MERGVLVMAWKSEKLFLYFDTGETEPGGWAYINYR
jgi:hypothetical protein